MLFIMRLILLILCFSRILIFIGSFENILQPSSHVFIIRLNVIIIIFSVVNLLHIETWEFIIWFFFFLCMSLILFLIIMIIIIVFHFCPITWIMIVITFRFIKSKQNYQHNHNWIYFLSCLFSFLRLKKTYHYLEYLSYLEVKHG